MDFDLMDDQYKASPGWWSIINDLEDIAHIQQDIEFELKEQYIKHNNLGIDYIIQYDKVNIQILNDMLVYVDLNYIQLAELLNLDLDRLKILAKSVYDVLFVDFINTTIPQICNIRKLSNPLGLLQLKTTEIKTTLLDHYNNTLTQLNTLYKINPNLTGEMLKCSFAIDMFGTDIDMFCEEFMYPVIIQYADQIKENL